MQKLFMLISFAGLAATILPALLFWAGTMDLPTVKTVMLIGTVVWFASCPLWMGRELPVDATQVEI